MSVPQGTADRVVAGVDRVLALRRRRRTSHGFMLLVALALVIWSIDVTIIQDTDWERMGSLGQVLEAAGQFVAVDWGLFPDLLKPALETFMIACLRLMMTLSRSIHEIVWALFFVAVVGLGALAGIFALAMRSVGFIAKMAAEAIEDIDHGPVEAIRAAGGNGFQVLLYAILPQVLPQVLSVIVFEWEINIRRSAILGLVGAGGLGLVFFRQMNTFNFPGVTSVILAILAIILVGEVVSYFARKAVI